MIKFEKVASLDHSETKEEVYSVLCFGNPFDKIISCSKNDIFIWDLNTFKPIKTLKGKHEDYVLMLMKMTDDVFLTCSDDSKILSISVRSLQVEKIILHNKEAVYYMLKIDADSFLSISKNGTILLIDYHKNEVLKKLPNHPVMSYSRATLSQKFANFFYVNVRCESDEQVRQINLSDCKIVRKLKPTSGVIDSFAIYYNKTTNEEMIAFCSGKNVVFRNVEIENLQKSVSVFQELGTSCRILGNNFLACGTYVGKLILFDLRKMQISSSILDYEVDEKEVIIFNERLHDRVTSSFGGKGFKHARVLDCEYNYKSKTSILIMTASGDWFVNINILNNFEFEGLEERDFQEFQDLKERADYLIEESLGLPKECVFQIRICNVTIENVFKSFLQ